MELLADTAARAPLLVVVEDAQWLDRPTDDVLAFVARRLASEPIVLLAAVREGQASALGEAGLPELRLEGLEEAAAVELLAAHAPALAERVRERLLAEAAGNPLALVELPVALGSDQLGKGVLPEWLPMTARLERAFAARVLELPAVTRRLLLVAAVDHDGALAEVLAAASILEPTEAPMGVEALAPAVAARLIEVDELGVRFRHPLMRSAIHQAASFPERHAAHAALARVLVDQPDRRAWHRAASSVGPDEAIAAELEEVAVRAQRRGGLGVAAAALERAAKLSADPAGQGHRLVRAAELEFDLGRRDLVVGLLQEAEPLQLTGVAHRRMLWLREMIDPTSLSDAAKLRSMVDAAARVAADGDQELAVNLLWRAAQRCFWGDPDQEARDRVLAAAEQVHLDDGDPRLLAMLAYVAPIERGRTIIDRLSRLASDGGSDAQAAGLLGTAAMVVGAFDLGAGFLGAASAGLRAQGRLGHLARLLTLQAWAAVYLADWKVAMPAAEEASQLAAETRAAVGGKRPGRQGNAGSAPGRTRGRQRPGRHGRTGRRSPRGQIPAGHRPTGPGPGRARGRTPRRRLPAPKARLRPGRCCLPSLHPNLGHRGPGRGRGVQRPPGRGPGGAQGAGTLAAQTPSSWFHAGMRHARPLLADDQDAEPLFQTALDAELARWPVLRPRIQLAYGAWLRRQRRVAESRAPLRAAREAFDALGAIPWGNGPARNSVPPARPAPAASRRHGTTSAPRSSRSPSWPPTGCPTERSASSSTSPIAR